MHNQSFAVDQAATLRSMALRRTPRATVRSSRLVLVTSGKGGVGKSTIAANAAIALARTGQKVLLVDGDPNLGNLDVLLGVAPKFRLGHVLRGDVDLEDASVTLLPGLTLLAGSSGDVNYPLFHPEVHERFLDGLIRSEAAFDVVILDSGAGITEQIIHTALRADQVLVISTIEPTAVLDAYALIKIMLTGNPSIRVGVAMNMVRVPGLADEAAAKLRLAIRHFLHAEIEYTGFVPYDEAMQRSVIRQEPLMSIGARSAAALAVSRLAISVAMPHETFVPGKELVTYE